MTHRTAAEKSPSQPQSYQLPFVKIDGEEVNFWNPSPIGTYEQGCAQGRAYAEALLAFIREHKNQVIFGSVIRAIAQQGRYEAVEIGFCARISAEIIALQLTS